MQWLLANALVEIYHPAPLVFARTLLALPRENDARDNYP